MSVRYPPKPPTNTLARQQYSTHCTLPYEFQLVKDWLIKLGDEAERKQQLKETK